jgi:hypothetical protein
MINKTLQHDNQLVINCPVFPTKSRIAACFILRDLVWRGDGPFDKRQGCQAAMTCGKCPIDRLVKRMVRDGSDEYHSAEPKERDFDADLVNATGRILITDKTMQRFSLTSAEQKYLLAHNESAKNFVAKPSSKPSKRISAAPAMQVEDVQAPKIAPAASDASELVKAAQSGDMSAAVNAAMEDQS